MLVVVAWLGAMVCWAIAINDAVYDGGGRDLHLAELLGFSDENVANEDSLRWARIFAAITAAPFVVLLVGVAVAIIRGQLFRDDSGHE